MGRLRTWIDRLRSAPPVRRAGVRAGKRRRLLAFEQCESRLVMSAAVQSTLAAGDVVPVADAMLQDLWVSTPGAAQWGEVTFAVWRSDASADESMTFPLKVNLASGSSGLSSELRLDEGGLIEVGAMRALDVSSRFSSSLSQTLFSYAFDGNVGISRGMTLNGLASNVMDRDSVDLYFPSSGADIGVPSDLGATYGAEESLFGDSDLGAASEPAPNPVASSVLRITSPLLIDDAEGGAIDLTAIVAPKAAFAAEFASHVASSSDVRVGDSLRIASSSTERGALASAASDADGLRARAVVFEVALAGDADADADGAARVESSPGTPKSPTVPASPARRTDQDTTQSAPVRAAAAVANGSEAVDAPVDSATTDQVSAVDGALPSDDASKGRAAALDAVLGQLGSAAESRLAVDIDVASPRQQAAGLALALVAGATPLIKFKRARRARATRLAEQSSGNS